MDRRIKRTRRLLAEALVELISETDYESITIRDITDRADIGYATFFRHYESKDALMLDMFSEIVAELEAMHEAHGADYFMHEGRGFFQHAADNAKLYRSLVDSQQFARKLRQRLMEIVMGHLAGHEDDLKDAPIPAEVAAQHMVASILGLLDWWLVNDQPYSVDEMAFYYERLVVQATWQAMMGK